MLNMKKLTNPTKYFFEQAEIQNAEPDQETAKKIQKLVSKLVNLQKCPLCKKEYSSDFKNPQVPRILIHCGHTFCHECLVQFYTKKRVRCPMCLKLVKHLDSLDQLPVNHTIVSAILQKTKNIPKQSTKSILFSEFQRAQKFALLSKAPPRFDPTSGLPFCPFHSDRVEHFYCETHKASGCRICSEVGHNNPECNTIDLYMIEDPKILNQIFSHFGSQQNIVQPLPNDYGYQNGHKNKVIGEDALWIENNLSKLDDLEDDEQHYSV